MDSIRQFWADAMAIPAARWVIAIFGLTTCVLIAVYVVKWFRDLAISGGIDSISHLTEFEKLHAEGKLNADEYQRLKKTLPGNIMPEMMAELKQKKAAPANEPKNAGSLVEPATKETPDFRESKDTD